MVRRGKKGNKIVICHLEMKLMGMFSYGQELNRWSEVKMRRVSKDSSVQVINNKYYKLYFYDSSRGMHMLDNHPL